MIVVSNSSPLIALARISCLDLLQALYTQVFMPQAVHQEVVGLNQEREGAATIATASWLKVCMIQDSIAVKLLQEQLDRGESEAIVLALEISAQLLLIDEARGRRIAQSRGITHIGTIGILILAKRQKLIPSGTLLLDLLSEIGFRMDSSLYKRAKNLMGEN